MKYLSVVFVALLFSSCLKNNMDFATTTCIPNDSINTSHPKAIALQQVMDEYTAKAIPGISLSIYDSSGYWYGASGYAKIEDKTLMMPCNLQYSQSVSKTYLAVVILKLYEAGEINLDEVITRYLSDDVISYVKGADKMTVRMLLNHTSGVAEYNDKPAYVTYLLQHPLHAFSTMDYLEFIKNSDVQFTAGSKYQYTNTNYELLALIADGITGDHAKYMRETIFIPLGLMNTYYHDSEEYLNNSNLVNSYWDRYSNGQLENCSEMQKVNVGSLIGDDGMIATPVDNIKFLKALINGQLLLPATMNEMFTFIDTSSDEGAYGLGIHKDEYNGFVEYGHSGGGIGAGCYLTYLPHNKTYLFLSFNIGTSVNSPIFDDAEKILDDVFDVAIQ